ncbi:beta-phosphoglucomutase family hydrolase [Actinospica durhamensis]|uniref:Beta-phosphoglucomutase n=1 Tax=Actinospica durhamensis TaxID=1508375 RepID=A0A941EWZ3_9ACTN|nr:beta-phosphoglucomutase family hydrolase [Actinospica durhamensis]MBR7836529.1 beta-phosphoglucomutase family hydrolase [Actinospica durhamensis]
MDDTTTAQGTSGAHSAPGAATGGGPVGLTPGIRACLFDLDGVLTRTASLHATAWKQTFDAFLQSYDVDHSLDFQPFDKERDYEDYVDGKPREDGVRSFLESRDIHLPEGTAQDPPGMQSVYAVGAAKQNAFLALLNEHGPQVFEGSVAYVRAARAAGLKCAVVTSSANCEAVLRAAGIDDLFDTTVDGNDVTAQHLKGKPAPDSYLAGAKALGVPATAAAVFEDAIAGVESGHAGGFAVVVGVDRLGNGQAERLRTHGATVVVGDLAELLPATGAAG